MSEVKEGFYYTDSHEYVDILENGTAYVGITDYAQSELGEIVFVDVPTVDEELKQFEIFGSIEAVKTVADLKMPVSGKVLQVSAYLENEPELVNKVPYESGWIIRIEVHDKNEVNNLMTAEEYRKFIGE